MAHFQLAKSESIWEIGVLFNSVDTTAQWDIAAGKTTRVSADMAIRGPGYCSNDHIKSRSGRVRSSAPGLLVMFDR